MYGRRAPGVDVLVERTGGMVRRVLVLGADGEVSERTHRPWMAACTRRPGRVALAGRLPSGTMEDYVMATYEPSTMAYSGRCGPVERYEYDQPYMVRRAAAEAERTRVPVSMANVRYEARAALDLLDGPPWARAPAVLYAEDDLAGYLREAYEGGLGLRVASFDLEVVSRGGGFPRPGDPVVLASYCVGSLGDEEPDCGVLEGDQVADLPRVLLGSGAVYVVGFNSLGFDVPYYRAAYPGTTLQPWGIVDGPRGAAHVDVMVVLDQHGSAFGLPFGRRLALDDAAAALGLASGEELEVEAAVDRAEIARLLREDPGLVKRYAETDALLTWRLGVHVLRVLLLLYVLTGIPPGVIQVLPTLGSLAEYTVYEVVARRDHVLYQLRDTAYTARELDPPSGYGPYRTHTKEYFPGPGIYRDVAEYDFNMLYPTIYASLGLGPGTRRGGGYPVYLVPRGGGDPVLVGAAPETGDPVAGVLEWFYEARGATKQLKREGLAAPDQAVKILANSGYGMFSKGRGMGVNELAAAVIFYYSNQVLLSTKSILHNVLGRRVVYAATDAVFVQLEPGDDPERLGEALNRAVRARFGPRYSLKLETVCRRFVLLKRKTYVCAADGGVVAKGFEKLQVPRFAKEAVGEAVAAEAGRPGAGEELLRAAMRESPLRELFVRTSKRPTQLYSWEERRWKSLGSNPLRAALLEYLARTRGLSPAVLDPEELPDYPFVAHWLPAGDGSLLYVLEFRGGGARVARCRPRASVDHGRLVVDPGCGPPYTLDRGGVEEAAWAALGPVLEYLGQVRRLANTLAGYL